VQEAGSRLLSQLRESGVSGRDQCRALVRSLCQEFADLRAAAARQASAVARLESGHLLSMDLSWQLLCEHWFHSLVYSCDELQAVQPVLCSSSDSDRQDDDDDDDAVGEADGEDDDGSGVFVN
uniref:LisH domain-containing protein n=1 Tax=Macrostomum lignano TaxID=282301 RepID=A0A1I8I8P7_9PLAT